MTVLHSGSTKKFAAGWDKVFSGGRKSSAKSTAGATKKKAVPKKSSKRGK